MMLREEDLPHRIERVVDIGAQPDVVFGFFTDSERWARWWGAGSLVDARVGGRILIRYPGGIEAAGQVLELEPPRRFVFSYGYVTGQPIPEGSSLVTIELEPREDGTRLRLHHAFREEGPATDHVQGWRYQLSLFANAVANEVHAGAGARIDRWFAALSGDDAGALATICAPDLTFRDEFTSVKGLDEVSAQHEAFRRFMPGLRFEREGEVRHCQGTALVDWLARGADGSRRAGGTSLFSFTPGGQIRAVTGFRARP